MRAAMFEPTGDPRCFALPVGTDFAVNMIAGLRARLTSQPPEAMARVEIFVNTRRTERRLHRLLLDGPPGLLPKIRVLSDLSMDPTIGVALPNAVSPLRRRLELSQSVRQLLKAVPDLAPESAAFVLADSLAGLMDEMQGEGVSPDNLNLIDVGDHAAHWDLSFKFLGILNTYFKDGSAPDIEAKQRMVINHLIDRWERNPPKHPIIVAGSTGSRGATADFMRAVAKLPQGAVVLPGYDFDLPASISDDLKLFELGADHPQAGLIKFIRSTGLTPSQIEQWYAGAEISNTARNKLLSLALRPAPVTDQWLTEGPALVDIQNALSDVCMVRAPSPRDEALTIALRMRAALKENQSVALITPDRQLTRQVAAALDRWKIEPDDSGGQPLSLSPTGIFLRLVADLFGQRLSAELLLALLKHPLTCPPAEDRNTHLLRTRALEIECLRGGATFIDFDELDTWASARKDDPDALSWAVWLRKYFTDLDGLEQSSLSSLLAILRERSELLAQGERQLWEGADGITASQAVKDLEENADAGGELSVSEFKSLFKTVLQGAEVREAVTGHPLITIWGTLEARVQGADIVILGGLNEGIWPKLPDPDPWLSRKMRADAGLLLPERRIGLSAHDFQQAIAAKEVMLTRSIRDSDAPTVSSRWISRLTNLLAGIGDSGKEALKGIELRGDYWLGLAQRLDTPSFKLSPETRPRPVPPISSRPSQLSVTQIKTLIRDPYSIYAAKVLRLRKLEPIRQEPDALLRGQALHSVLEEFVRATQAEMPNDAKEMLLSIAESVLLQQVPWSATRRLWLARLMNISNWIVDGELSRRNRAIPIALECSGKLEIQEPIFTLVGKADRIDLNEAGEVIIYDYKSGAVPTMAQVKHFDKQLPLEAIMAQNGAFSGIEPAETAGLEYIGLGSTPKVHEIDLESDIVDQTWAGLKSLISAYQQETTGYAARARMEKRTDLSDYDHLSRLGEWSDSDEAVDKVVS